jgi:hypothetical protein
MLVKREWILLTVLLTAPMSAAAANVVTDWDAKAVDIVQAGTAPPPPLGFRTMAILHSAMFDAVNSIHPRYKPYKVRLAATPDTSKEAAAAAAAAAVLIKLFPDAAADVQATLTTYLATLPDGEAKSNGVELGRRLQPRSWKRATKTVRRPPMPIGRKPGLVRIYRPPSLTAGRWRL